jgi:hypothetical protein
VGRYGDRPLAGDTPAFAVVRPEQVVLGAGGELGEGRVEDVRFLGGHARVSVRLPDDTLLRAQTAPGASVEPGMRVRLGLEPGAGAVVRADDDD